MEEILSVTKYYKYAFYEKGNYIIEGNQLQVKGKYRVGQYIRIENSVLNDGVFKVLAIDGDKITLDEAINEKFYGIISSLKIPRQLIKLAAQVEEFKKNEVKSVLTSESFDGYSYSKATDKNGNVANWQTVFKNDLSAYMCMCENEMKIGVPYVN